MLFPNFFLKSGTKSIKTGWTWLCRSVQVVCEWEKKGACFQWYATDLWSYAETLQEHTNQSDLLCGYGFLLCRNALFSIIYLRLHSDQIKYVVISGYQFKNMFGIKLTQRSIKMFCSYCLGDKSRVLQSVPTQEQLLLKEELFEGNSLDYPSTGSASYLSPERNARLLSNVQLVWIAEKSWEESVSVSQIFRPSTTV